MKLKRCDSCKNEFEKKKLKKIGKVWRCDNCYKDKLSERQEFLKKEVLKISKKQEAEEDKKIVREYLSRPEVRERNNKYHREYRRKKNLERRKEKEQYPSKIKGSTLEKLKKDIIKRQSRKGSWYIFGYLTKVEKLVLYKKYISQGMTTETAGIKIKGNVKYLSEFVKKLRQKQKSDEEIRVKFKEEFAKLIMDNEDGNNE